MRVPGIATLGTEYVLRQFEPCPVCGRRIRFSSSRTVQGWQSTINATCHGSSESLVLEEEIALAGDLYAWERAIDAWRDKLFAVDLLPDVMELIRQNNNPWVFKERGQYVR